MSNLFARAIFMLVALRVKPFSHGLSPDIPCAKFLCRLSRKDLFPQRALCGRNVSSRTGAGGFQLPLLVKVPSDHKSLRKPGRRRDRKPISFERVANGWRPARDPH